MCVCACEGGREKVNQFIIQPSDNMYPAHSEAGVSIEMCAEILTHAAATDLMRLNIDRFDPAHSLWCVIKPPLMIPPLCGSQV